MIMAFSYTYTNVFIATLSLIPFSHSFNFQYPEAKPSTLQLEGDAEKIGGRIEFVKPDIFRVGRVTYNGKVPLWDSNSDKLADFTTHFNFVIDFLDKNASGDGFAFFLAPAGSQIPPNSGGCNLGLFNTTPAKQTVAVEFDTVPNPGVDPPNSHVGIDVNSIISVKTGPWNASLHSGDPADVWIAYNAATKNFTVYWSYSGGPNSSLDYIIDLKETLPEWITVGFSATTGSLHEQATLRSWEFSSSLDIEEGNNKGKKIGLIVGLTLFVCLFIACAVAFMVWRKGQDGISHMKIDQASMNDDLERGAGPRRFSYKELALATYNFSEGRKLGEGGFGRVYKGHLLDLDLPVAVKKFSGGCNKHGRRQYTTEVKIISMLRHRNLVRLIGWCHDEGEFLLVYEFMPNGSLDHHLFSKRNTLNDWMLRYKIVLGLASSLLYLHEEWEQCVIHRDIKSSNVMLDSGFNVKLGDFGLARLMDHGLGPQTTGLAGTFGYMAPEYVATRRASKESDVYSFGVVALEIATGRKSVEPIDDQEDRVLLEWIWDMYGKGRLLSGVDERLRNNFEAEQVERLMVVGLWCAHPDSSLRPSIRQAILVLNFEAELPQLEAKMPVAIYHYESQNVSNNYSEPLSISSSLNMGR